MKRLLIDAGNTNIKLARVCDDHWSAVLRCPSNQAGELNFVDHGYNDVQEVWVSNVAGDKVARQIVEACSVRHWSPQFITAQLMQCGVMNGYEPPVQLGSDRWAALIAAWHITRRACLVVGCGTATTIDALSDNGEFLGGLILPGIELMRHSLFVSTANLQVAGGVCTEFPRNTSDALLSGAIQATCGAIQRQYASLGEAGAPVLLSGGGVRRLLPHLALPTQMTDDLVLQGLLLIAQKAGEV
ncbi:MAG: type III pantothenate kinase [Gallionella sp.]|nr:type III pantothenate kinase [Gallionella sp.]